MSALDEVLLDPFAAKVELKIWTDTFGKFLGRVYADGRVVTEEVKGSSVANVTAKLEEECRKIVDGDE